jgi:hypothetical protein
VNWPRGQSATDAPAGTLSGVLENLSPRGVRVASFWIAAVGGALGAVQAVVTLAKISSDGALTLFGVEYRYVDAAWGPYLVLVAALALAGTAALTWLATRDRKGVGSR